jgi:hypothetical protein
VRGFPLVLTQNRLALLAAIAIASCELGVLFFVDGALVSAPFLSTYLLAIAAIAVLADSLSCRARA